MAQTIPTASYEQDYATFNDGLIYIAGGRNNYTTVLNTVYSIDSNAEAVTRVNRTNLPSVSGRAGTCIVDDRYMYVAGGLGASDAVVRNFMRYDRVDNTWTTLPPVPGNNISTYIIHKDGYIYALLTERNNAIWRYSIANNTWKFIFELGGTKHASTIGVIWNNELYLIGGWINSARSNLVSKLVIS